MRQLKEAGPTGSRSGMENYRSYNAYSNVLSAPESLTVPLVSRSGGSVKSVERIVRISQQKHKLAPKRANDVALIVFLALVSSLNAAIWIGLIWLLGRALTAIQFAGFTSWRVVESYPIAMLFVGGGIWGITFVLLCTLAAVSSSEG